MATGKKAIYVDGPWFYSRKGRLGIQQLSFAALKGIVSLEIGSKLPIHEFMITLKGAYSQIAHPARRVGIEPILVDWDREQEEELLIERIWALPPEVTEIIVVTGDIDFHSVLIEKARQGVEVWILGTRQLCRDGRCATARAYFNPPYRFVDLADYAARLEFCARSQEDEETENFLELAPDNLPEKSPASDNLIRFPGVGQIVAAGPHEGQFRLTVEFTGSQADIQKVLAALVEQELILRSQLQVALQTEELA